VKALEFRTRLIAGRSPPLDPHLKAYALDDNTAAMLGGVRLSTDDWIKIFTALAARKPHAILVDGMFSSNQDVKKEQEDAIRALADLPSPVIVGALVTPLPIKYRSPVASDKFLSGWTQLTEPYTGGRPLAGARAYGPTPLYQSGFKHVGHIVQEWPARFAPAFLMKDGEAIPHIGLYAATRREIGPDGIRVDGHLIPSDADGLAAINFLPPALCASRVKTLRQVVEKARAGQPIEGVNEGDTVLIINNYSTGNTDILDSPFGPVPGGYIILSIINSVIRGDFIARLATDEPFILLLAGLGAAVGALSSGVVFWLALLGVMLLHLGASLAAFALGATMVPWLFPLAGFAASGLTAYARQRALESKRRNYLENEVATASALQQQFFPPPNCREARFDLAAYYVPADAVGGDWYSYRILNGRYLHMHLGDVTGHGTPAALLASFAKGATDMFYDDHPQGDVSLAELHRSLNKIFMRESGEMMLMTLFSIAIDLETGACQYLNSGHKPAFVLTADGRAIHVLTRAGSTILGHDELPPNLEVTRSLTLAGNETILIMSDGLVDVPNSFGIKTNERTMRKMMKSLTGHTAEQARDVIVRQLGLETSRRGREVPDDITFMVTRLRLQMARKRAA
jgi:serine phosphatase RsbU (regulator of sigma subunit)